MDFPGLVHCKKSLSRFPGWSKPEEGTGYIFFAAPIEIAGVVEASFVIEGGCYQQHANLHVSFELALQKTITRRRIVLERIEWRSLRGGHSNKRGRPSGIPARTKETHWHKFELKYNSTKRKMIGDNLPIAQDLEPPPITFEELRDFVGSRFQFDNMNLVQQPDSWYDLFNVNP